MNIAAYTSSLNNKDALKRCIQALLGQTYPIGRIIVVDNRSSDGTQREVFPDRVALICHLRNLGTSGAVASAFQHAMAAGYEWMWVLDQDSVPREDALERLVELYNSFPAQRRDDIGILSSLVLLDSQRELTYANLLTPTGPKLLKVQPDDPYCECDTTIWSGSLYRLEAVRMVGLPRFGVNGFWEDFSLDQGDIEFGYRIRRAGYRVLIHPASLINHHIGDLTQVKLPGKTVATSQHPPFRRYLSFRNMVFFWLYVHPDRRLCPLILFLSVTLLKSLLTILLVETDRTRKISACLKGVWDGLFKNMRNRY